MERKSRHWHSKIDAQGVAWLAIDVENAKTNSLSAAVLEELEHVLTSFEADLPDALVIHSGKQNGFIAGADVNEFGSIGSEQEAVALIKQGQAIISKIESFPKPTIAVINGFCLGGGLELALACDYRIVVDAPSTRLGLPEIKLGIHPGFGGTVRSIRAVGSVAAMQLMLTGRTLSARQAQRMGLVDARIPERQIANAVRWYIEKKPSKKSVSLKEKLLRSPPARKLFATYLRQQTAKKANQAHYPAPFQLINLWEKTVGQDAKMYAEEAQSVAKLITGSTAKNLIRVFHLQEQLKSYGKRDVQKGDFNKSDTKDSQQPPIQRVHVIGAGTMGGDIASWCALQGMTVSVEDANNAALASTIKRAETLFAKRFRDYPHLKIAAHDRITADPKGYGRQHADVIIEAIFENEAAKKALFTAIESVAKKDALLATNTSSIPLEKIATALSDPGRLVGLHFFNPVAKMPLVEVIHSKETHPETLSRALSFTHKIGKLPLPVKSSPGFLVNRVLTPYLMEAATLYDQGVDIRSIDRAAKNFGMPMGPLELADTVGLDVCLNVAEELSVAMEFQIPDSIKQLVQQKKLGKKSGSGFYQYSKGKRVTSIKPVETNPKIQNQLIDKLVQEAQRCLDDGIVSSENDVDAGIIFGIGFAPFTGGPLHFQSNQK